MAKKKQTDLEHWFELSTKLAEIREEEMSLRKKVFDDYFPQPVEGTNTAELDDGYALKGMFPVKRSIDEEKLLAVSKNKVVSGLIKDLVNYKPSLDKKQYDLLTDEERRVFDACVVSKPGSISLKIVEPAKKKA